MTRPNQGADASVPELHSLTRPFSPLWGSALSATRSRASAGAMSGNRSASLPELVSRDRSLRLRRDRTASSGSARFIRLAETVGERSRSWRTSRPAPAIGAIEASPTRSRARDQRMLIAIARCGPAARLANAYRKNSGKSILKIRLRSSARSSSGCQLGWMRSDPTWASQPPREP
jgi:hypothetical protein